MFLERGTRLGIYEIESVLGAGGWARCIAIGASGVTLDGERFIMVKDEVTGGRLNVVLDWLTELNRLSPASR